ncbi:hypothetical protein GCM10027030_09980 [Luteococcus sediminum]
MATEPVVIDIDESRSRIAPAIPQEAADNLSKTLRLLVPLARAARVATCGLNTTEYEEMHHVRRP